MNIPDFFASEEFQDGIDTETGKPGISYVANAIQFWAGQQQEHEASIRNAAIAFRCDDAVIRAAVESHYWMYVTGPDDDPNKQIICHEGE